MAIRASVRLKPEQLRWNCDPDSLGFETTNDFTCRPHIIGQDRALEAIRLGLDMRGRGYNIYVAGLTGTGKSTATRRILESFRRSPDPLQDICFVANLRQPDRPACVQLRAGAGRRLQKRLIELLEGVQRIASGPRSPLKALLRRELDRLSRDFPVAGVTELAEDLDDHVMNNLALLASPEPVDATLARQLFLPFAVNIVVDNSRRRGAPVVVEHAPDFLSLFGTIERHGEFPGDPADFTGIRAGALHRAHGGYLLLDVNDLLEDPSLYIGIKRALKGMCHEIRGAGASSPMAVTSLKPEPVMLDCKVILIGDTDTYQVLYESDEDFGRVFKVKAEFDSTMANQRRGRKNYARFVRNLCTSHDLRPFHKTGVAALIEAGVRLAGNQQKLSTRFGDLADLAREADLWARRGRSRVVRAAHVKLAAEMRRQRVGLSQDRMQEMFEDGTILLDTRGSRVGQVNGLAVFDMGDHSFGKPSRITAETGVGRSGVINIEREADLSGRLHNKGVLILEGYLRRMYAQDKPLTMTASICFEQAYTGVEGDSASSAEIYALLSSISGVPLRQDIAVTGSVNQKGEVQPIGGVNEKIEGFYEVCVAAGLTGTQGVMIPDLNVTDLMLRDDVINAVRRRKFHIYAVRNVDEGIEILSRMAAGRRTPRGLFTRDGVHQRVDDALWQFHEQMRLSENGGDDSDSNKTP